MTLRVAAMFLMLLMPACWAQQPYNAITNNPTADQVQQQRQIQTDAKGLGATVNQQIYNGVKAQGANPYGNSPVPRLQQGQANGTESNFGTQQIPNSEGLQNQQDCRNNPRDARCAAVNSFSSPGAPFTINRRTDPLIQRSNQIANNPINSLGSTASSNPLSVFPGSAGFTGTMEQCRTVTDVRPAQRDTFFCNEYNELSFNDCSSARQLTLSPEYTYRCLDQRAQVSSGSCSVGRVVTLNGYTRYQCDVSVNSELVTCDRVVTMSCSGGGQDGCDAGGIVPGSVVGDMRVAFTNDGAGTYNLEFGTFADNYWSGWGAVFDRNLQFEIKDVNNITQFALVNAAFDDWIMVKLNDNLVYVGPYGGDRLEVTGRDNTPPQVFDYPRFCLFDTEGGRWNCYENKPDYSQTYLGNFDQCDRTPNGTRQSPEGEVENTRYSCYPGLGNVRYGPNPGQESSPELATSWNINIGVDMRPFLKNGQNTLFMRTIVAGNGEGAIRMATRQKCPSTCTEQVQNQCAPFEARVPR